MPDWRLALVGPTASLAALAGAMRYNAAAITDGRVTFTNTD
jgi:hypothetical protein